MIKIENIRVAGFIPAIQSIRNSYASWDKGDSEYVVEVSNDAGITCYDGIIFGDNDLKLAKNLIKAGEPHCKFRRMIAVWMDITAPLYWWKQFDTYKIGTVANSESTMHNIADNQFTNDMFSISDSVKRSEAFQNILVELNNLRRLYKREPKENKQYFNDIIALLPESYNQRRSVMLNYSVLANMYEQRKNHKLGEWAEFCDIIVGVPHGWMITGDVENGAIANYRSNKREIKEMDWENKMYTACDMLRDGAPVSRIAMTLGLSESTVLNYVTKFEEEKMNGRENTSEE